ncbi:hypothetical protein ACFW04_012076 [Cataglyphis niger]
MHKQRKFMNMPTTKSIFEKQLTIVAQYFQPHVSYSTVKIWLDGIAQTRDNNINDNFWNEIKSKQIMCILNKYIFLELKIHELYQLLMISDFENKHMQYIAESLQKYLLTFTYHIVARRLGIHTVLRSNGMDILVVWKSKQFALGIIIKYSWQHFPFYNHYGVIIGWYYECNTMFKNTLVRTDVCPYLPCPKYSYSCKCDKFSHDAHQTHYILLADQNRIYINCKWILLLRPPRP